MFKRRLPEVHWCCRESTENAPGKASRKGDQLVITTSYQRTSQIAAISSSNPQSSLAGMPPKSAAKKAKAAAESASEGSDASEPVKKKRTYKRKTDADKPATSPQSEEKKPAPKRAKKQALTEPETTEEGWTLHPPSLIYRWDTSLTHLAKFRCSQGRH